jgi:predicted RND superfamily exporter protein
MDETTAMFLVYIGTVALGIIIALLARSFWLPSLLIGLFLLVLGLLTEFGMMPLIDAHLNVSVANREALFVLVGVLAFFAVLKAARYLWKRKKSKEQQRDDIPPEVLAQWEPWLARNGEAPSSCANLATTSARTSNAGPVGLNHKE